MKETLRIAQYGCGKMSVYTMRYVYEKGGEIVCAFDVNPDIVGKDIGEIMGCAPKGVKVQSAHQAEHVLSQLRPDACIVTTMSLMRDLKDALMLCARQGINAITTCEEAFYPWNSSPALTMEIDVLARKNGCTICGSGYQDVFWGNLIAVMAGATHRITKISGKSSYNVEDYGIALARAHGAGLDLRAFETEIASSDNITHEQRQKLIQQGLFMPSYMWNVNGWLASKLGLNVVRQTQKCVPQSFSEDLTSSTLDMTIPAGYATGMSAVVTTETAEGVTLQTECIGKVYNPDEYDVNQWAIDGEPHTQLIINRPCTVELTCATIVNRLPDLIHADPGFTTTEKMPANAYRSLPINEYV